MSGLIKVAKDLSPISLFGRFVPVLLLVGSMWVIHIINFTGWLNPRFGLRPRHLTSLLDIFTFPFVHGGLWHIMSNTLPLLILGSLVAIEGVSQWLKVTFGIITISGALLWAAGPYSTVVVGASGLIFGYVTYMLARAYFAPASFQKMGYIAAAVFVAIFYGASLVFSITPLVQAGVSWQAHLCGAIAGIVVAYALRTQIEEQNKELL